MGVVFGDFVNKFNLFRESSKIDLGYVQSRGYGWRLGTNVQAAMLTHLEDEWPDAPDDVRRNFHAMFDVGNDLLGIPLLGVLDGALADSAYLVAITETKHSVAINNVDFKRSVQLGQTSPVRCPVSGQLFNWTCLVKLNSTTMIGDGEEYTDTFSSSYRGTLVGKRYTDDKVRSNDINGVAAYGTIDYKSGVLELSRSSNLNIKLLDTLIAYVKANAGGSGTGGSHSGSTSTTTPVPSVTKDYGSFTASCTMYTAPVTTLWTYKLSEVDN